MLSLVLRVSTDYVSQGVSQRPKHWYSVQGHPPVFSSSSRISPTGPVWYVSALSKCFGYPSTPKMALGTRISPFRSLKACSNGAIPHLQSLAGMPFFQLFLSSEDSHSNVEGCSQHLAHAAVPPAGRELSCISQCMSTAETLVLPPQPCFPRPFRAWKGSVTKP